MFKKKIKIILKILGLLFYAIIFLEIFARFFLFFITLNLNIFLYGFNNNIGISSHSFKKFEFYVYNNKASYKKKHNTKLNEILTITNTVFLPLGFLNIWKTKL